VTFFDFLSVDNDELFDIKLEVLRMIHSDFPVIFYTNLDKKRAVQISDRGFELNSPSVTRVSRCFIVRGLVD
jgi:hypothetical protein